VDSTSDDLDDSHLSMMERRPWTRRLNRQLPTRFRDMLPQTPPALPPSAIAQPTNIPSPTPLATQARTSLRRIFTTPPNVFGLFRQYETNELPSHDPDQHLSLQDLSNIPGSSVPSNSGIRLTRSSPLMMQMSGWMKVPAGDKLLFPFQFLINLAVGYLPRAKLALVTTSLENFTTGA